MKLRSITTAVQGLSSSPAPSVTRSATESRHLFKRVARAQAAEAYIQSALNIEAARAQEVDAYFQSALNSESTARAGAITEVLGITTYPGQRVDTLSDQHAYQEGRINTEISRATGVEASLQPQISALLSNIDDVALNSLAELVTDYRQNGQGVADSIATYQVSNDSALAAALAESPS